jgi:hypothetical protein
MLRYIVWALAVLAMVCLAVAVTFLPAHAQDRGAWFKSLMQPNGGGSCCDISDCKRIEAQWIEGGWAILTGRNDTGGGNWLAISPDKVLERPRSIDGDAYVCASQGFKTIYCFVPPWTIF